MQEELEALRLSRDAVAQAVTGLDAEIRTAQSRIDERILDVLSDAPNVAELLTKFREASEQVTILRAALEVLPNDPNHPNGPLPRHSYHSADDWHERGRVEANKWREAIKALSIDANASLPEV
jgi:hypothetical protein